MGIKAVQSPKERQLAGQGAVLLCAILWSTSGLFIKLIDWHPVVIAGGRSLIAALFLLVLRQWHRPWRPAFGTRKSLRRTAALFAAGSWYAATMILFVTANKLTASANAILLQYTAPVWAGLLGWLLLKEKPHWEHWGALALVSLGMFLVFRSGLASGSMSGDILALLSGIAFATNSVVLRGEKDANPADIMICSHILTVLFTVPFAFAHPPVFTVVTVPSILFMGIFQLGAASALFVYGIRRISALQAMLTASIEPVLNPVWVLIVTGERPALSVITGGLIIVAAVALSAAIGKLRPEASNSY